MPASTAGRAGAPRCALHPARLAVDSCPRCTRPRCGADAASYGDRGCGACAETVTAVVPVPYVERVVRAGAAAFVVALIGGWVGTQYVDVQYFSVVAPGLVGLATGWAATAAAAGPADVRLRRMTLLVGAVAAVLSAGLGFRLESGGGQDPVGSWGEVGPPYLAAVIGTLAWPIVFAAPTRRPAADEETDPS